MTLTAVFTALWLGIMTSISPCPMTTNIAAISLIGRKNDSIRSVLVAGFLYSLGRTVAYLILGGLITSGLLQMGEISRFLQQYMNEALGPILILLGLVLLGWLGSGLSWQFDTQKVQEKAQHGGIYWAFVVGFLFALSFCPVSAALFFGALLPLAIKSGSAVVLPFCYGAGTALPVIVFAFLLAFASSYVSRLFNRLTIAESWIRNVTGIVFILVGVYYTLIHIYGI